MLWAFMFKIILSVTALSFLTAAPLSAQTKSGETVVKDKTKTQTMLPKDKTPKPATKNKPITDLDEFFKKAEDQAKEGSSCRPRPAPMA